jgi:hypothetical protein
MMVGRPTQLRGQVLLLLFVSGGHGTGLIRYVLK